MNNAVDEILKLSVEERLEAVEKIWDSITDEENIQVPEWHLEIVRERIKEGNLHKERKSWDEIKAKYNL